MKKKYLLFAVLGVVIVAGAVAFGSGSSFQGSFLNCNASRAEIFIRNAKFTNSGLGLVSKNVLEPPAYYAYSGEVSLANQGKNFNGTKNIELWTTTYTGETPPAKSTFFVSPVVWNCKQTNTQYVQFLVKANTQSTVIGLHADATGAIPELDENNNYASFELIVHPDFFPTSQINTSEVNTPKTFKWKGISFAKGVTYTTHMYTGEPQFYYTPEAKYITPTPAVLQSLGFNPGTIVLEGVEHPFYNIPYHFDTLQASIKSLGSSYSNWSQTGTGKYGSNAPWSTLDWFTNGATLPKHNQPTFYYVMGQYKGGYYPSNVIAIFPPES